MHGFGNEHFYGMERGYHLGLETSHILYFRGIGVIVVFLPRFNKWAGVKHLLSNQLTTDYFFEGIGLLACLIMSGPCRRVRVS